LERCRRILRDLFDITFSEKRTARLDRSWCIHAHKIHGVLLAVIENQERPCIDHELTPVHDPSRLTIYDRLDRQWAREILNSMPPRRSMKDEIIAPELTTVWKQILLHGRTRE